MHSSEGTATKTSGTNSTKSSASTDDNNTTTMGLIREEDSQNTSPPTSSDDEVLEKASNMSEMEPIVGEYPPTTAEAPLYSEHDVSTVEPLHTAEAPLYSEHDVDTVEPLHTAEAPLYSGHDVDTVEPLQRGAVPKRHEIHPRQRSIDSVFPDILPSINQSTFHKQLRRKLQGSLSWPTAGPRVTRLPFTKSQHGGLGYTSTPNTLRKTEHPQDQVENNTEQMTETRGHVTHIELPFMERESCLVEASSPTQEISQILRDTRLRSPSGDVPRRLSFDDQLHHGLSNQQLSGDLTPTNTMPYTITSPGLHLQSPSGGRVQSPATRLESSVQNLEQMRTLRRFSFEDQLDDTHRVYGMLYGSSAGRHYENRAVGMSLEYSALGGEGYKTLRRLSFDEQVHQRSSSLQQVGELTNQISGAQYAACNQEHHFQGPPVDRLESSASNLEELGELRRLSFDEHIQRITHYQSGELTPPVMGSIQDPSTRIGLRQSRDRLSSSASSHGGEGVSRQQGGASAGARPRTYPCQYYSRGASAFPHLRSGAPHPHPEPQNLTHLTGTIRHVLRKKPARAHDGEGSSIRRLSSDGHAAESAADSSWQQSRMRYRGRGRRSRGFPKTDSKMLQICDSLPSFPFHQTPTMQQDTEFMLDDSWGPSSTPLPNFANAFNPRAPSPGAFSIDSNVSSEYQEWMDLSDMSPAPSPASLSEADFENLSMLIQTELQKEINIHLVCQEINISPDPLEWTIEEVARWLRHTSSQFRLPEFNLDYFYMDGLSLCHLTEKDFQERAPKCGDNLFLSLQTWKIASQQPLNFQTESVPEPEMIRPVPQEMPLVQQETPFVPQAMSYPVPQPIPIPNMQFRFPFTIKTEPGMDDIETASVASGGSSSDEQSIPSPTHTKGSGPDTSMTPNHTGSIHLWQFLKELLLQPESYSYCIRWIDRSQGIFKIEDSVKVASLWGRRKNRPAMNYDKMSRSIRQYYKKGIMKKTEVSQRLVYQFVHPC